MKRKRISTLAVMLTLCLLSCASTKSLPGDTPSPGAACADATGRIRALSDEELAHAIGKTESLLEDGGKMRKLGCRLPLRLRVNPLQTLAVPRLW